MIRYHEDRLVIREVDLPARLHRFRGKRVRLRYLTRDEQRTYVQQGVVKAIKVILERLRQWDPNAGIRQAKDLLDSERCYVDRGGLYIIGAKGNHHYVHSSTLSIKEPA